MKMPSSSSARNKKQVWPPGFRFHPTDEELVLYYLKRKVCGKRLKLDIIAETDVYKWDPEDLPGLSKLKTGDRLWFFFSPRDRKYPNGARSNRATIHGYWKATGKDRHITCNSRSVGLKKTLVFYKGRAPSGIRTDWVMHEYTLDEEELKRCQNVGDYYALYKVYKKSGPGPKNGEQYGAPFKEEDWVDEDCVVVEASNLSEPPIILTSDMVRLDKNLISSVDEIEGLWNSSTEIPDSFHQKFGNEIQSTFFDPSGNNTLYTEQGSNGHPVSQQCADMGSNFDYSQSAASQVVEVPDITSGFNVNELNDFLADGDFLEANDLLGPEPVPSRNDNTLENLRFDDAYDGLGEWDLYIDASMVLPDTIANDLNSVFNEDNGLVKQFNYQVQPQLVDDASFVTSELWEHQNLTRNEISSVQSGSVNGGNTSFTPLQDNQNDSSSLPQNRVTSALWAFVESIPTTPASASENILFSQALERVSSFRRTRLSSIKLVTAAGTEDSVKDSKSRSVILFSIIGAVCAMLWVLFTRTSVPVL